MHLTRRSALAGALSVIAGSAFHTSAGALDIVGDDGKPVPNLRLPNELSPARLPGIVWVGSRTPDVTLVEVFDYNCPYCKIASPDLDALLAKDKGVRLGLVNNAILGVASVQAAKVQQAVLKLAGPERAYAFHKGLFARRGVHDGAAALQVAASLGLTQATVEGAADGDDVTSVLTRQAKTAQALGLEATPSFAVNGVGILGYPGPRTMARIAAAVRTCERPAC